LAADATSSAHINRSSRREPAMTQPVPPQTELEPGRSGARVVVVGTSNVDLMCRVPSLPRPGETILAESVIREFGGKGANQAVAAARQDARVTIIGAVGDDDDGHRYLGHLEREGIDVSRMAVLQGVATGTAHVYVDARGENFIVVNPGANGRLDAALVRRAAEGALRRGDILVVQLECPLGGVLEALRIAATVGAHSLLNASPVHAGFPWGKTPIDTVIVNEHECRECFGHPPERLRSLAPDARLRFLAERNVGNLVISQGSDPTLWISAEGAESVPTYRVVPRDTVGAGDTLAGVLAAQLAAGIAWREALRHANVAAALSTLAPGAQAAMPNREEVCVALGRA
jgi:ribokinase